MTDSGKIKCPACGEMVSARMPNCPFCTQELPARPSGEPAAGFGVATPAIDDEVAALAELTAAKEKLRQSQPTLTDTVMVTGPITALIALIKPSYGSGAIMVLEVVLAILALPTILVGVGISMIGVRRWGQVSASFVLLPAGLVTLVAWKMPAPVGFPVLLVSLIAFGVKTLIGMSAKVRRLSK